MGGVDAATRILPTVGIGSPEADLALSELRTVLVGALANVEAGARVLAIVPDKTRDDNTHLLFPEAAAILRDQGIEHLDALIAQGTHGPMTPSEKEAKLGVAASEFSIFDHCWSNPKQLVHIGEISAAEVCEITRGAYAKPISLSINRLLSPGQYDVVLVFGATVPHEVAGFAGGAKYFFPGVAGPELTHATHWIGALTGIENIIGRVETTTRRLIERAAQYIATDTICFTSVVTRSDDGQLRTHALFGGDLHESFRSAADISKAVHIKYTGRTYRRVVALLDDHYEDLWVGGKASYKLGGIIESGGELIIYAPHLKCLSETHGEMIERYGYGVIERMQELAAESGELEENLCVAAHLAHVAYAGRTAASGDIVPKFTITLASQIDEGTCRRVNLGYLDPTKFSIDDYRTDDTLVVERAGRDLYLVQPLGM